MEFFVSNDILTWKAADFSFYDNELMDWNKCYSYLEHAEKLLSLSDSNHFNADVISNLKKAIDHRIKHLANVYKLKSLGRIFAITKTYELLAELKVIRPIMLGKLLDVRNSLEHQFSEAPKSERCAEYVEFVWYFLKSTDALAKEVRTDISLTHNDIDRLWLTFDIDFKSNWSMTVKGWIPECFVSNTDKGNSFKIIASNYKLGAEKITALTKEKLDPHWEGLSKNDLWVCDANVPKSEFTKSLVRRYFSDQ